MSADSDLVFSSINVCPVSCSRLSISSAERLLSLARNDTKGESEPLMLFFHKVYQLFLRISIFGHYVGVDIYRPINGMLYKVFVLEYILKPPQYVHYLLFSFS